MANCRANEERVRFLSNRVRVGGKRLASIGCGSCLELWEQEGLESCDFLLLDQDKGALERAKNKVSKAIGHVTVIEQNILKFVLRGSKDGAIGHRDFVYAFGLFDYFDHSSASRLTKGLWQMVAPGGVLLVTNAHPGNPTRLWMEYGGDWFLKYKTSEEMMSLSDGLEAVVERSLRADSQGVYQFLEIRKDS